MLKKMKKKIRFREQSECAWPGEIKVQHVLPDKFVQAIGPFVFLEDRHTPIFTLVYMERSVIDTITKNVKQL
jgi:hypothetical protein